MSVKKLIDEQIRLQNAMGHPPGDYPSAEHKLRYLRELCLALHVEVSEFLQEIPWKPWCTLGTQRYNPKAAAEELADVMIFTLNLWIHLGAYPKGQCADELVKQIARKQNKNTARLKSGRNRRNEI